MVVLNKKLKAGTILETMVALTIVMISFGIALMIFNNVNKSNSNFLKIKAALILNEAAQNAVQEKLFIDNTFEQEGISVIQKVEAFENMPDIKFLHLEAKKPDGKIIAERKELILVD